MSSGLTAGGLCVFTGTETKKEVKKARKSGGLSGTSSDESNSNDSDGDSDDSFKSVSSGDEDDFNPFKDDSSEDDEDGGNLQTPFFFFRSFTITENIQNILICLTDPWLIRKETKKSKEKKNKKKKKSIDPDSIQSALLASGLGTTRPTFTAPAVKPSNNSVPVGESYAELSSQICVFSSRSCVL